MNIFKKPTTATEQIAKAETQLAAATESHAQALQALDSARLAEFGEHPDPKATDRARKAVQAAAVVRQAAATVLQDATETLALIRARDAQALTAEAAADVERAAAAKRARISALVKSRNRLAGSIDASVRSMAEDWIQLAREDVEIVALTGGQDIWDQTLVPGRLAGTLTLYMGAKGLPFPRPIDVTQTPSFESVIVDTGNALIERAKMQGGL